MLSLRNNLAGSFARELDISPSEAGPFTIHYDYYNVAGNTIHLRASASIWTAERRRTLSPRLVGNSLFLTVKKCHLFSSFTAPSSKKRRFGKWPSGRRRAHLSLLTTAVQFPPPISIAHGLLCWRDEHSISRGACSLPEHLLPMPILRLPRRTNHWELPLRS